MSVPNVVSQPTDFKPPVPVPTKVRRPELIVLDRISRPKRQRFYTWSEMKNLPPPEWLIEGHIPKGQTTFYGPYSQGKTFVALDHALPLALASKSVVYIAGEGMRGIPKRVQAWLTHRGHPDAALENFIVHSGAVPILDERAMAEFVRGVGNRIPELIVIDTLARCFVG